MEPQIMFKKIITNPLQEHLENVVNVSWNYAKGVRLKMTT